MKEIRIDMTSACSQRQFEVTGELTKPESDDVYVMPTSVAQQRFWILDQLEPGNTSLNMPLALQLTGKLDTVALQRTFNEIVSRHEVLRTTFSKNNGRPVQVVTAERSQHLEVVDLSSHHEPEGEVDRLMVEEAHITFDLARGPLFKTKLVRLGKEDHVLLLTLHHIVCDGWSNGVLVREIGEIYDAFSHGRPSPYDELTIQYGDFAAWQQDWIKSDGFEDQLAYWKQQLGSELPSLEIPTDFPREKKRASFGAVESLLLPQPLIRALKAMGQREDVTPFMIFLAAFNVLLGRYSGQQDILIGSPTANRQQSETEDLIGAFANTLLLRFSLSGDPSFKELLFRVKEVSLGAFSNQTIPFEKLVETIRPATNGRKGGRLFQVLFIFQTAFMQPMDLDELSIKPMRSVSPGSIFELSLGIVERQEGTRLQLEYNTDLFKAETIKLMLADLQSVLQSAVLDANRKTSKLLHWTTPLSSREGTKVGPVPEAPLTSVDAEASSAMEHDRVEESLIKIWQDVLQVDSIDPDTDFFEIGGHSLLAALLFDEIANRLGVRLPLATLFNATTIEKLANIIQEEKTLDKWTSLVAINTEGSRPPLFLMHAVIGNVLFYKDLANRLGSDQPVYGLQAVGLDGRQAPYDRIEDMAAHYAKEISSVQPKGPYFLGGSSSGGLIAYEVGQQLRKRGDEVKLIALFDTAAPGYPKLRPGVSKIGIRVFKFIFRIRHQLDTLRLLESGRRWPYIKSRALKAKHLTRKKYRKEKRKIESGVLRCVGFRPPEESLSPSVITERAIRSASAAYKPLTYQGDVVLFRASTRMYWECHDDTLGWSNFVHGRLEVHETPGSHWSIIYEPRVGFIASTIRCLLEKSATLGIREVS